MKAELLYPARAELAEGPVWHGGALWWVDIITGTLNHLDVERGRNESRALGEMLGAAAPCSDGRWVLALEAGFALLDWGSGQLQRLTIPGPSRPRNRFNDGKCDPAGRFWAGTLHRDGEADQGALYVLDHDLRVRHAHAPVSISNGLAWSADGGTFYYIDSLSRKVAAFDFDTTRGELSGRRDLFHLPEDAGLPDGMSIDNEGNLWIALWGGGSVICLDPGQKRVIEKIELPVTKVTSCCFGGPSGDILFITSAWQGSSPAEREAEPLAGGIFQCRPGVSGPSPSCFKPAQTP